MHAKLHASSSHSFAYQVASLSPEVANTAQDLVVQASEPDNGNEALQIAETNRESEDEVKTQNGNKRSCTHEGGIQLDMTKQN